MVIWSPGSAGSAVGGSPSDSTTHAQSSSNSNPKENALRSSWIQRLRPVSGTNVAGIREKKPPTSSSGAPSLVEVGEQEPRQWLDENAWSKINRIVASEKDSGKKKMVERKADDDSAIRHGCGSIEVGERASYSASKALCVQNYARNSQDECMKESLQHPENVEPSCSRPEYLQQRLYAGIASPLVHCPPHPVMGFDPALGVGKPVELGVFPSLTNFGSYPLAPLDQTDYNYAEQSGLRWAGYSPQFGAHNFGSAKPASSGVKYDYIPPDTRWRSVGPFGNLIFSPYIHGRPGIESSLLQLPQLGSNSLSKFSSGLKGAPCPPRGLKEAATDSTRFGQNCGGSSELPMRVKAHMTKDQPLANDSRPSQNDRFLKKVLHSGENVFPSGFGRYEGDLFGKCTTKPPQHGSKIRQEDKKAPVKPEAKRSTIFFPGSIEMKQRRSSGVGRAGYHSNQDEHRRRPPNADNLEGFVMNAHSMGMREEQAGFARPQTFVEKLIGADRLTVEQGIDQAYVLTPIFARTEPFSRNEKKKSITAVLHKEGPEPVLTTSSPFFFVNGAKTSKELVQHSASTVPNYTSKESCQEKGLDFYLTSLKRAQRPVNQVTSDSITASLPREFVGDLYGGTCSLDPKKNSEGSSPYGDVLRAQRSSLKQFLSPKYQNYLQDHNENMGLKQCDEHGSMAAPRNRLPESK